MASVSQNGRRKPRPWTAQDQITAEVAAACGVSFREIGRVLGRGSSLVVYHVIPAVAKKASESSRRWRKTNAESVRETNRRWQNANSEKARETNRSWQKKNPDKVSNNSRRCRQRNLDKYLERSRRWKRNNADKVRELCRRRGALRRSARRRAVHPVTRAQIDARFALWDNRCAFCGVDATHERNHGHERLTVEHVLALTKGGLDEAENIIPACSTCNTSKNNSPIEDWYRRQPWFTDARWRKVQRHCPAAVVGQLPLALAA
jgi:hypothetical protein